MNSRPRLLVPEVVQTSAMDCGPASLKCLLEGFRTPVSYGRLREACQTDVDGTSINTLEEIAVQLGLDAEQIMVPVDHVLLAEAKALPAIIVVRLPNGFTHFVVAWGTRGPFVQVMDPATGRRWTLRAQFLDELYVHTFPVPAEAWREWASSEEFLGALRRRLDDLGITNADRDPLIQAALESPGWHSIACLDAAARLVAALIRSGGLHRGAEAARVLETLTTRAQAETPGNPQIIPSAYWSVQPAPPTPEGEEQLLLRGAVLVRVRGHLPAADAATRLAALSPELSAALEELPIQPWREIIRFLRTDGRLTPVALLVALGLAASGVLLEVLLFRGLLDVREALKLPEQRLGAIAIAVILLAARLFLESGIVSSALRFGRRLEARLRMAFLEKIPRLSDHYFRSRPTSDMAERSHSIHHLRQLPDLARQFLQITGEIILTTAGMIWIHPAMWLVAALAAVLALAAPLLAQPVLVERDLRVRTHVGALARFYLDTLLGLVAVRTHGAERSLRREHESLLVEWARAKFSVLHLEIARDGVQLVLVLGCVAWILIDYLTHARATSGALLLAYWGLYLPLRGRQAAYAIEQYAVQRNLTLRLLEPLGAREEPAAPGAPHLRGAAHLGQGLAIALESVNVRAAGHLILEEINVSIEAGQHLAIVGPSGAGKSSLVGLLLGWHRPATGHVCVDGIPLEQYGLERLRHETAWVDPAIQIWNRSLVENLRYGAPEDSPRPLAQILDQADLLDVLRQLPDGLQTSLGEGGGLVSGGEGQRVRFGRALLRPEVRLVILDEPFRGLDHEQRRGLLARARRLWQDATLLCITHDVAETQAFKRILVIEHGRIVEDGAPAELAAQTDSRYRAMLEAEQAVREGSWSDTTWRRLRMEAGRLTENSGSDTTR